MPAYRPGHRRPGAVGAVRLFISSVTATAATATLPITTTLHCNNSIAGVSPGGYAYMYLGGRRARPLDLVGAAAVHSGSAHCPTEYGPSSPPHHSQIPAQVVPCSSLALPTAGSSCGASSLQSRLSQTAGGTRAIRSNYHIYIHWARPRYEILLTGTRIQAPKEATHRTPFHQTSGSSDGVERLFGRAIKLVAVPLCWQQFPSCHQGQVSRAQPDDSPQSPERR